MCVIIYFRALQAELKKESPKDSKTWLCFGNMFIKCPKSKALSIVEKGNFSSKSISTLLKKLIINHHINVET